MGTSLLAHVSHKNSSEYGAVSQHSIFKTTSGREHFAIGSEKLKKDSIAGDRRNEFFTLKRYIFMTLGMPGTPAITSRMQRISSKLRRFYIILATTLLTLSYMYSLMGFSVVVLPTQRALPFLSTSSSSCGE